MNLYEGIKSNLNEMGSFSSRMDTLRAAGEREANYRKNVVDQKFRKAEELFSELAKIQDDVSELKEINRSIKLYDLKARFGLWLDASGRGLDVQIDGVGTLYVDTDKIMIYCRSTQEHEVSMERFYEDYEKHDSLGDLNCFIKLATKMVDTYPSYVEAVNSLIDDYDLKYPEIQESAKLKEAGKALGRGLEDLISTSEDASGLNKIVGSDSTSLNSREGFKEIYGEDASYTDIRKIVEELEAINEQAVEDGFNFTDKFATIITDLSSICADIEDFYEHR